MPFKGLWAVRPPLCLGLDTISIGLRTTEESRPSDSSTAVITFRFLTISLNHIKTEFQRVPAVPKSLIK